MSTFEEQLSGLDRGKLRDYLLGTIQLYREFVDRHGYEDNAARYTAVGDMVDGVEAIVELEKERRGETPSPVRLDPLWDEDRIRGFVERTVGRETLPTTSAEFVKFTCAVVKVVTYEYEQDRNSRDAYIEHLGNKIGKVEEELREANRRIVELESEVDYTERLAIFKITEGEESNG